MSGPMFKHKGSIPVDEAAVAEALETLKNHTGGILNVSVAILNQLGSMMASEDFAALKLEVADAQWLAKNADRLGEATRGTLPNGRTALT